MVFHELQELDAEAPEMSLILTEWLTQSSGSCEVQTSVWTASSDPLLTFICGQTWTVSAKHKIKW